MSDVFNIFTLTKSDIINYFFKGDAMKANEGNFGFMEQENNIEIPFFQRPYVWSKPQWEQLFEDLFYSFKERRPHFLGSIILK